MRQRRSTNAAAGRRAPSRASADIDAFVAGKRHPREEDIHSVRKVILGADPSIREEIKWNSVSFRNDHDFFATVNLRSTGSLQLVFHTGAKKKATAETGVPVSDPRGLIERWLAPDRCLVTPGNGPALDANRVALTELVKEWIGFVR